MKYYTYCCMWKVKGSDYWNSFYNLHAGTITELFEEATKQPETWVITSVVEISEDEYRNAKARGNLG